MVKEVVVLDCCFPLCFGQVEKLCEKDEEGDVLCARIRR
jgi:hypothetical protein